MPSSRRVAVIGAAGQLGTDLVAALRGTGAYHVTPWPHEHVDVTRREQIDAAMEETRPDIVVNCAAFHQVDECEDRVAEALRINGHGASEVARACRQAGAARPTHIGGGPPWPDGINPPIDGAQGAAQISRSDVTRDAREVPVG
jgi:nucleoside-diphosphate-sugar epimerase